MKFRGPLIGLGAFMAVAIAMTWLVYVTLRREVSGSTTSYSAMFTDVSGLKVGDDVRVAGVRVGRVDSVEVDANAELAQVAFRVQDSQPVYGNTIASITYQNVVGQRYLGLSLGKSGDPGRLLPGSTIPVQRTEPSFDIGMLLHGFEPLLSVLDPKQVDNLTKGVIESLQGDTGSLVTLVDQTSTLTQTLAGRDEVLGQVIFGLNNALGNLAAQNKNLGLTIANTRQLVTELDGRRQGLVSSVGATASMVRHLSSVANSVYPQLHELATREPGFAQHMVDNEPQVAFLGDNLPLLLKGLARVTQEGAYGNIYVCDVNALGFLPGLNDVMPIIVNAATPGNVAKHTAKCRNGDHE
ncbi:MCE family protein [Mycobacterium sp. CBMA271]|uniref:MlaD family protein n=1 Tax=unclassified Mycobacteroides TaxID=2618759 RepID=UPI0012DDC662|nr:MULTISPECIES: MlaD family protein [unclassified Mycobacteroides]MUM19744.1 mammalian cell entry protein [Mycobacteroides sp. CBMA 326]MUM21100.1 MCE family protein [Mycobacteroides sp. CBMA 271]